jgi:hypothetical protein
MDFQEGWGRGGVDWMYLAQDTDRRLAVLNTGNETSGSIKCREFLD